MPTYPLMQVDAFTTTPLGGNPCAIVLDADPLDEATMQAVAREMNLSETAFVLKPDADGAEIRARYFTPAEEIPLAGHPTIATLHALFESGRFTLAGAQRRVLLQLQAGVVPVDCYGADGRVSKIVMTQMKPTFLREYDPADVLPVFGLSAGDAFPGVPVQTVSTGTPQLMMPLRSHDALRRATLNIPAYADLRQRGDFFSPHLFALGGATDAGDTFARHFGTPPDTMEDPFTGSATGGMAAFLWRYQMIDQPAFTAEQGHWMERPGSAEVTITGAWDDIETVTVGGAAVTIFSGELRI